MRRIRRQRHHLDGSGHAELSRDPVVWWNVSAAGVAIFALLLAINRIGDALRDVLDPRTLGEGR